MNESLWQTRHNLMYNDYVLVGPKTETNECLSIKDKII